MADRGKIFHLTVVARDQGTPTLSSTALVVIQVGELSLANTLQFQESFYEGKVSENSRPGTDVLQVINQAENALSLLHVRTMLKCV